MIQGLSLGGEYGSSATYLSEMAGRERRGFWSSFQYVTIIGGQLLALALLVTLQAFLTDSQLEAWGWRLAPHNSGAQVLATLKLLGGQTGFATLAMTSSSRGVNPVASGLVSRCRRRAMRRN